MLIENITLLREKFPEVRKYFLNNENELYTEHIEIKQAKSGLPTAVYQVDGKAMMVHSIYDPVREADRIIKSHAEHLQKDTHVMFFGMGMGYHIEAFNRQYPDLTYSIYEPFPEVFLTISKVRKLGEVFSKKLNGLYVDQVDVPNLNYLQEFHTENRSIHIIILPSYENIAGVKKIKFFKQIKDSVQNRRSELHTNAAFQKRWIVNSIRNFNEVLSTPNIMHGINNSQLKDKPAIIVSAGPSLAEDIEHIRYIKDNSLAYIFSAGSAINSLLSYDILPDAVFTYDPSVKNQLVFTKMNEMGINSIPMIFGSSVGYETLENYHGPKSHFLTTQDRTSIYFLRDQLNIECDIIMDSPSIAVMTFDILNKLGSNPIIFAGQNLGYLYGRRYSKGIEYAHVDVKVDQAELEKAITVQDVYGNEIKTTKLFNVMKSSIENIVDNYKEKIFINTTKGGAAIKGIAFSPIEEVINEVLVKKVKKETWWTESLKYELTHVNLKFKKLYNSRNSLDSIIDSFRAVQKMLALAKKINSKQEAVKALEQFDTLYNSMIDNLFYKEFLSYYLRIFIDYFSNEILLLNRERDVLIKANRLHLLLVNFHEQLQQGINELTILFKDIKFV
ncbi:DUF115 domain-containing protein [Aciduricibacillus chroicocephali]|uniref:DUF115 domain-containing protein n=1 Tax=Aciduricibacillus chroicocephali TaxID=3054939 RepID=A0ABY9KXG3_9BACI|nr:DUF115 domain-containing protein [Bacillaceae bacterium 44XB]